MVGGDADREPPGPARPAMVKRDPPATFPWLEFLKAVALPLVTLFLGFLFNSSLSERQARDSNMRLYTEMMARREQADSELRKDMFKSILDTFMSKESPLDQDRQMQQEVLNLELLAYNFHESLDIGPLFKDVRSRITEREQDTGASLLHRLEKVGREVIERQLTSLSDSGTVERGSSQTSKIEQLQAYLYFGSNTVPNPAVEPGKGITRLCLTTGSTDGPMRHRQFVLEIIKYDPAIREVLVRLYVSQPLALAQCRDASLELVRNREIDTNFWVGLFDFPLIDNTRLTHGERCSVSLTELTPNVISVAVAYFPGSRASLKDKPYYEDVIQELSPENEAP